MVTIRELTREDAAALATMLNDDAVLRADLGIRTTDQATADSVLDDVQRWRRPRQAVSYAILAEGVTVGMISLSRIDLDVGTGRIGYWVGSSYRRLGYCTRAFQLVLEQALHRGLHTVEATIINGNTGSRRLWEKAGGIGTPESAERTRYQLPIDHQQGVTPDGYSAADP